VVPWLKVLVGEFAGAFKVAAVWIPNHAGPR